MPELTEEQWERAGGIHGWYDRNEAELLYRLCDGGWCEVGCWRGLSTVILAQTGHPGWAVDWFKGSSEHQGKPTNTYDDFMRYIAPYDNVTVLPYRYQDCVDEVPSVRFLHLDAEHTYEATAECWGLYAPKVVKGGHLVLHDAFTQTGRKIEGSPWPGVTRWALEMEQHPDWDLVDHVGRSAAFRRI